MTKSEKPVAIITGGSRGVGEATAKLLASEGWNITITCTSTIEDANKVVEDCEKLGVEGLAIKADVSDDKACRKTIEETIAKCKPRGTHKPRDTHTEKHTNTETDTHTR